MKKSKTLDTVCRTFCRRVSLNGNDLRQARASAGGTNGFPAIAAQGSPVAGAATTREKPLKSVTRVNPSRVWWLTILLLESEDWRRRQKSTRYEDSRFIRSRPHTTSANPGSVGPVITVNNTRSILCWHSVGQEWQVVSKRTQHTSTRTLWTMRSAISGCRLPIRAIDTHFFEH